MPGCRHAALCAAVVAAACAVPESVLAQDQFPYTAYVAVDRTEVTSGPGDEYYACTRLAAGDAVEVYRHDPGGWCAIRPPEGCTSWISSEYVKLLDDETGVVIGDRVAARVATDSSDERDVIQVRLDYGEEVRVLDCRRDGTGPDAPSWYRIAPPAGEFRWIRRRNLSSRRPDLATTARREAADTRSPERSSPSVAAVSVPVHDQWRRLGRPGSAGGPRRVAGSDSSPPRSAFDLERLEYELSATVVGDVGAWRLSELAAAVRDGLESAPAGAVRDRAARLLERIERFQAMQERYLALDGGGAPTVVRAAEAAGNDEGVGEGEPVSEADTAGLERGRSTPRFDGSGELAEVVSEESSLPRYALMSPDGQLQCYVSPAPGVNLRRYVGRPVGVIGTLGYLPDERARHVTARRVTALDGALRR